MTHHYDVPFPHLSLSCLPLCAFRYVPTLVCSPPLPSRRCRPLSLSLFLPLFIPLSLSFFSLSLSSSVFLSLAASLWTDGSRPSTTKTRAGGNASPLHATSTRRQVTTLRSEVVPSTTNHRNKLACRTPD